MRLKKIYSIFILCFLFLAIQSTNGQQVSVVSTTRNQQELLLRMPLLSDKSAGIIEKALSTMNGIQKIEASYETGTMIITYLSDIIGDENIIVEKVRQQEINSTVEALSTRDIHLIRKKFEVVVLHSTIIN